MCSWHMQGKELLLLLCRLSSCQQVQADIDTQIKWAVDATEAQQKAQSDLESNVAKLQQDLKTQVYQICFLQFACCQPQNIVIVCDCICLSLHTSLVHHVAAYVREDDIAPVLQSGTGNSMMIDGGDAGGAAPINLMEEDRVGMFGGRSKRRR